MHNDIWVIIYDSGIFSHLCENSCIQDKLWTKNSTLVLCHHNPLRSLHIEKSIWVYSNSVWRGRQRCQQYLGYSGYYLENAFYWKYYFQLYYFENHKKLCIWCERQSSLIIRLQMMWKIIWRPLPRNRKKRNGFWYVLRNPYHYVTLTRYCYHYVIQTWNP